MVSTRLVGKDPSNVNIHNEVKVDSNGNLHSRLHGSDGSTIHGDGNGNVKANVVSAVSVYPHSSANAQHASQNTSLAVGNMARTDIADPATQTHLKCNASGNLMIAGSDGSTIVGDGSGNVKANVINAVHINPSNALNGDHANQTGHSVVSMLRGRTDIADHTTGKFIQVNSSGQLNTNVVNSVNVELHGHTDIADTNTSVRLKGDSLGSLIVEEAPPIYASPTTLGNTNRLDNSNSSGLSDTIDMNGFRNLGFSVKYTADSGQDFSSALKHIYIFASFDNSEFFNTGSSLQLAEHNISGASGTYRGFGFVSNFSARYLKLGGNVGGTNFSACEVKFVRTNGGF